MLTDASETSTLGQSVYLRLREMILSGELAAGDRVQEVMIAEQFGVSRTPVREAIGRLSAEGLLTRGNRGAPVVHRISVREIMEILHVRRLLECEAARLAAGATGQAEDFLRIRSRFERFLAGEHPSPEEHLALDGDLHDLIARSSGSVLLRSMVATMKMKTRMFDTGFIPERFEPGCQEHMAIIDAILAEDAEAAEACMKIHLENTRAAILSHLSRLF